MPPYTTTGGGPGTTNSASLSNQPLPEYEQILIRIHSKLDRLSNKLSPILVPVPSSPVNEAYPSPLLEKLSAVEDRISYLLDTTVL